MENRRQIFVESEYDQAVFQEIFAIHKNDLSPEKSLEFIPPPAGEMWAVGAMR